MSEEIFDVCDAADNVIGQATRSEVHRRGLLHRAVHIWVWNSHQQLLVHLRSANKDEYPSCYTSSASGHLESGETYEAAAWRELNEELNLSGELEYVTQLSASPKTANEHTQLYQMTTDATPEPDPSEIAGIEYLTLDQIEERLLADPQKFSPPFRSLLEWWLQR